MLALTWAAAAFGYDWGIGPAGGNGNYHMETGSFTAAQLTQIDLGAAAWNAGAGEVLRGADWHWTRDSDVATAGLSNGHDEVYMRDQAWFDAHNAGGFIAVTRTGVDDTDIAFKSTVNWCNDAPAGCASGMSIGQTAAHEFGHRVGFQHENDVLATMNANYPFGGDMSGVKYRINEDDSVGLQDHKTDSSTGKDLMLAKFLWTGTYGDSEEVWDDIYNLPGHNWEYDLSDAAFVSNAYTGPSWIPQNISAIIEGTSSQTPLIEWRVAAASQSGCFDGVGTEYVVATRTPTLGAGTPMTIGPTSWSFASVPAGTYWLCAKVDPYDSISETADNDNNLKSERLLTVVP